MYIHSRQFVFHYDRDPAYGYAVADDDFTPPGSTVHHRPSLLAGYLGRERVSKPSHHVDT